MKATLSIPLLAATLVAGLGHNDWDRPCLKGECAYDLPAHKGQSGTIKLVSILFVMGPPQRIDIVLVCHQSLCDRRHYPCHWVGRLGLRPPGRGPGDPPCM